MFLRQVLTCYGATFLRTAMLSQPASIARAASTAPSWPAAGWRVVGRLRGSWPGGRVAVWPCGRVAVWPWAGGRVAGRAGGRAAGRAGGGRVAGWPGGRRAVAGMAGN